MIEFVKPGPNKRVCAFLIDLLLISALELIPIFRTLYLRWFYILFKDCFGGQSIGKRIVGIRVVDNSGGELPFFKMILRNITLLIPFVNLAEYFVMRANPEGKRLGDLLVRSKVTDLKPEVSDGKWLVISMLLVLVNFIFLGAGVYFLVKSGHLNPSQNIEQTQKPKKLSAEQMNEIEVIRKEKLEQLPKIRLIVQKFTENEAPNDTNKRLLSSLSTMENDFRVETMHSFKSLNSVTLIDQLVRMMEDKNLTEEEKQTWLKRYDKRATAHPNELS